MNIQPLNTKNFKSVSDAALADNHIPLCLTHGIFDDTGNVIGSVSCERIPVLSLWLDSQKASKRDCLEAMIKISELPASKSFVVFCAHDSPFFKYMEDPRFGCLKLGDTTVFLKTKNP